jgi:hypothetical protein
MLSLLDVLFLHLKCLYGAAAVVSVGGGALVLVGGGGGGADVFVG